MSSSIQPRQPIIAVVGPTASGKSELGIALALRCGGEIVNCDSVQVYREIEIATAKVSLAARRGVAHHLLDFVPPAAHFTAGEWARLATEKIAEIEARRRLALLVGGTGLYLRALREPFFESPPTDESLRRKLVRIRAQRGAAHLHRLLRRVDPAAASKLSEHDWSRTQRALEFFFQTGQPLSEQASARPAPPALAARLRLFVLSPPRAELYRRINARTEAHFAAGLVDEVRALLARGVPAEGSALGAHGYRRVVEHLRGERSLESALEQTKLDVRHYAKRQLTWFRREPHAAWFAGFGDDPAIQAQAMASAQALMSEK